MQENKQKQLEIIQKNNKMQDDYHTGIRTVEDIKTLEETITTEYNFVSSTTITDFIINKEDGLCFRISVPIDASYSFNLQAGSIYKEESSYYQFDYSLESAINKLIDDKVGTIINADY